VLWSASILRSRLGVHGIGLVVLGQAVWFVVAGVRRWRLGKP